jgi:hypothetical protein
VECLKERDLMKLLDCPGRVLDIAQSVLDRRNPALLYVA